MTPQQAKELLPIITAFAQGREIQCKNISGTDWLDIAYDAVFCLPPDQYRIKPDPIALKYRRYIYKNSNGWHICAFSSLSGISLVDVENMSDFVRWIDDDWITYFIPSCDV